MYRGMIHLRMNDHDAAASDINAALELKPGMSQLRAAKAVCGTGLGLTCTHALLYFVL